MSLTAFQRVRRMKQVEEMKPENIIKAQEEKEIVEEVKEPVIASEIEDVKEEKTTSTARRRNTRK